MSISTSNPTIRRGHVSTILGGKIEILKKKESIDTLCMFILNKKKRKIFIFFLNPKAKRAGLDLGILASTPPPNGLGGG